MDWVLTEVQMQFGDWKGVGDLEWLRLNQMEFDNAWLVWIGFGWCSAKADWIWVGFGQSCKGPGSVEYGG